MHLTCAVQDRSLGDYAERLKRLGVEGRVILSSAMNSAGAEVRLLTVEAEAKQVGLPEATVAKAQKEIGSSPSSLSYRVRSEGGNIRLKFFGAQESEGGVVAHPLGAAQVFSHAFMKGGKFPDRVSVTKLNGQVFERIGPKVPKQRQKIAVVRSGVFLPDEMVTGRTADVFRKGVATIVATAVVTKLGAMVG